MVHLNNQRAAMEKSSRFKYILCYGSSFIGGLYTGIVGNLNTSYVMVHHIFFKLFFCKILFKYILCYGSSSTRREFGVLKLFKYILCYGSSA